MAGAGTAFNEVENNYFYHYKGRIIAYDRNDNDKIITLTDEDLGRLAAQNPELLMRVIAGIGQQCVPVLALDSAAMMMNSSQIFDLNNPMDRSRIAKESDMGYLNLTDQNTRIYVQTGMKNSASDAGESARRLGELLREPTGYINNGTEGLENDVGEYLPDSLSLKDVLNEYTYRTLNTKGPTLIVLHSAGNEDARKALLAGSIYGHQYENLSFVSLGSPVGSRALQTATDKSNSQFAGQVIDWKDPITYSKTAVTIGVSALLGGAVSGLGYGVVEGCKVGARIGALGCLLAGGAGAGVGLAIGALSGAVPLIVEYTALSRYHAFDQYIAKPQTQRVLLDWQQANP